MRPICRRATAFNAVCINAVEIPACREPGPKTRVAHFWLSPPCGQAKTDWDYWKHSSPRESSVETLSNDKAALVIEVAVARIEVFQRLPRTLETWSALPLLQGLQSVSPQAHMTQRHSAFWASITNSSVPQPDDPLHKAIGEGLRAAARAEADRRQGMARNAAMLAYRAQRLPMPGDGHCLFHGLDRLHAELGFTLHNRGRINFRLWLFCGSSAAALAPS